MINCIALDDEPFALEVIKAHCSKIPFINLTHTFTQISAARKHLRKFPVDLIFLDIQMPDMNGVEFYENIEQKTMVIFTTAHSNYAIDGFNVNAIDYLLKPIELNRFEASCKKAYEYYNFLNSKKTSKAHYLYVRSEYALVQINFDNIHYMETMDDYIKIHLIKGKTILTLMSMKKMLNKLPSKDFFRVHRSFIVSLSKIKSVRNKTISLNNIDIPLGNSYKSDFMNTYTQTK